jgi:paraquat-inducible protein B
MSKRASPTVVGSFFLGALGLLIAAVALFGSGTLFSEKHLHVLYFEGSVAGLQIGSPVTVRGVRIGSVTEIRLLLEPTALVALIPVYVELEPGSIVVPSGTGTSRALMPELIKKGLRARLVSTSFVTGQLAIDLEFLPDTPVRLVGADKSRTEIPTVPSKMEELTRKLEQLPLDDLVSSGMQALEGINRLVQRPELAAAIGDAGQILAELRRTLTQIRPDLTAAAADMRAAMAEIASAAKKVGVEIAPVSQEAQRMLRQVRESVSRVETSLNAALTRAGPMFVEVGQAADSLEKLTTPQSQLMFELTATLREFQSAARNIKGLAETLERSPEALLRGRAGGR